jgi:hypothetical protein
MRLAEDNYWAAKSPSNRIVAAKTANAKENTMELLGWDEIAELDLEWVKNKLMHGKKAGAGWSRERTEATEREYRRFLYLMKIFPNELTAPTLDVDRFWHQHILDTRKYAHDCQAIFGYFLHHYPYLGLNGEQDEALRHRAVERMCELYRQTFGTESGTGAPPGLGGHAVEAAFCAASKPNRDIASGTGSDEHRHAGATPVSCATSAIRAIARAVSAANADIGPGERSVACADTEAGEPDGPRRRLALLH